MSPAEVEFFRRHLRQIGPDCRLFRSVGFSEETIRLFGSAFSRTTLRPCVNRLRIRRFRGADRGQDGGERSFLTTRKASLFPYRWQLPMRLLKCPARRSFLCPPRLWWSFLSTKMVLPGRYRLHEAALIILRYRSADLRGLYQARISGFSIRRSASRRKDTHLACGNLHIGRKRIFSDLGPLIDALESVEVTKICRY